MIETALHPRIIGTTDWATIVFVLAMVLIAISKATFESRFNDFVRLLVSDKYLKMYRDSTYLMSGFTILLFLVQLISLAFFIQLVGSSFGWGSKTDGVLFLQLVTLVSTFILGKFLIENIIGTAFNIEEFADQFNLQKVSYRTYIGLLLLPIDIILFYNANPSKIIVICLIVALLLANLLTYFVSLKNYQNLLFSKLFYFILYLCALEIAPYYFMYYWFTKS